MAKLFKILFGLVGLLLLLAIIALFVIANNLGGIIKTGINDFGPDILGVPVSVDAVNVSLLGGTVRVSNLHVANPSGFSSSNIFELDEISLAVDLESLRREVIVIDSVVIDGAAVSAEQVGRNINLQVLANNLDSGSNSSGGGASASDTSEPVKIAIARFAFTNAEVAVSSDRLGDADIEMPDIALQDIGTAESGLTVDAATRAIMKPLMKRVIDELKKQALNKAVDKNIDKALDKALGDKAGEVKSLLKGLLKR